MDFQPVKASDKEIIDKYMKKANSRSCDMSFAAVYLWKDFYLLEYTVCEDMLIFRTTEQLQLSDRGCQPGKGFACIRGTL